MLQLRVSSLMITLRFSESRPMRSRVCESVCESAVSWLTDNRWADVAQSWQPWTQWRPTGMWCMCVARWKEPRVECAAMGLQCFSRPRSDIVTTSLYMLKFTMTSKRTRGKVNRFQVYYHALMDRSISSSLIKDLLKGFLNTVNKEPNVQNQYSNLTNY